MFVYPHGIHVDRDGNIWVADGRAASPEEIQKSPDAKGKGHTVFKLSPEGKVLMTFGKPGVAGTTPDTFNQPTDIIVAPNGDIFISDGHGGDSNARILKFTKDGKFIKTWGKKGSGPGEFDTPHNLAFDSRGRLFVADRGNSRIQIFDQEGTFLEQWKQFGRPSGVVHRQERHALRGRLAVEREGQSGLQAGHLHRQRQGRQGHRVHPGSHQPRRIAGRRGGGCQGQRLRVVDQRDGLEEIRERLVAVRRQQKS